MKNHRVLRTVHAEDRTHVALLETSLREAGCDPTYVVFKFGVGHGTATGTVNQRRLVSELIYGIENEVRERDFGDTNVRVWSAKDHSDTEPLAVASGLET